MNVKFSVFRLYSNAHHFMNYFNFSDRILFVRPRATISFFLVEIGRFLQKLQPFKDRRFLKICQVGTSIKNFYLHQTLYKLSEKLVQT